jgi:hypothetical protein
MAAPGSAWVGGLAIDVERVPDDGDGGLASDGLGSGNGTDGSRENDHCSCSIRQPI